MSRLTNIDDSFVSEIAEEIVHHRTVRVIEKVLTDARVESFPVRRPADKQRRHSIRTQRSKQGTIYHNKLHVHVEKNLESETDRQKGNTRWSSHIREYRQRNITQAFSYRKG